MYVDKKSSYKGYKERSMQYVSIILVLGLKWWMYSMNNVHNKKTSRAMQQEKQQHCESENKQDISSWHLKHKRVEGKIDVESDK